MKNNKKIKIMYVNYSLDVGGIETLILEKCKRLNRQKFMPAVCAFVPDGKLEHEFVNEGIQTHVIPKKEGTDWSLPLKLVKLFKKEKVDVVHTHNQTAWLYGGIAAKLSGLPLIQTMHTSPDYHIERWKKIEKMLSYITTQITAVARSVADFMVEEEGVSRKKIRVIYNGIKSEIFNCKIDVGQKKREMDIGFHDLIVGNIARLAYNKNHEILIQVFKQVVKKIPSAKLLIAGEGPLRNKLQELINSLEMQNNITLLGVRRDIPELLQIFDIFVLPSRKEGLPIVLLEAMAAGLPTIASNVDGNAELVLHDETGIIVPAEDQRALVEAIITLLQDKEKAKDMGEKGLTRVKEHFSFDGMVRQYEDVYAQLQQ